MEQLKIQKEQKPAEEQSPETHQNGDSAESESAADSASIATGTTAAEPLESETSEAPEASEANEANEAAETDGGEIEKHRGIPKNVKLFEIFHEQVATLVKMQRLSIQDTVGLLVSLANLALWVPSHIVRET